MPGLTLRALRIEQARRELDPSTHPLYLWHPRPVCIHDTYSYLHTQVPGLTLRALRNELARRELDSTGSRSALEARLLAALGAEAVSRAELDRALF